MVFSNPDILKNSLDVRIGGIEINDNDQLSYLDFMSRVKGRILQLVIDYVKENMADGVSYEAAIEDLCVIAQSQLDVPSQMYAKNEDDIVDIIVKSAQFSNWETSIYYRYMQIHEGVVDSKTPIAAGGTLSNTIDKDLIEEVEKADSLNVFLDGLASI